MLRPTAALLGAVAIAAAQEPPRLRNVEIATGDVFTDEEAAGNILYALANLLHGVSDPEIVRREIWLLPGQPVHVDEVAEVERNLRSTGWFGKVTAELRPVAADGAPGVAAGAAADQADLLVTTRDRFSLGVSASASRVGGKDKVSFAVREANLFGTGKGFAAVNSHSDDGTTNYVRFTDPQLFGSRHFFEIQTGSTDEGQFTNVTLERPFRRLDDPLSYGILAGQSEQDVNWYQHGETIAEVPLQHRSVRLFVAAGSGPRQERTIVGLDLRAQRDDYDTAFGAGAAQVRVPGDTDEVEFGPYLRWDYRPDFHKVQRIDAIDYDEDLTLGATTQLRLAGRYRAEDGKGDALQPVVELNLRGALTPAADWYLSAAADGTARTEDGTLQGWRAGTALHAYWLGLPQQTLCGSATFDTVGERQDLMPQLTLGEDNGLRGYPAREFAGTRMGRINLEDRIDTGLELWSVRLGLVAFTDVGFMHDAITGQSLGDPIVGAGFGMRFGSSHLFGNRVLRLDVAWPLTQVSGEAYGVSVSFSVGQVFTFFGNANTLSTEY